MIGTVIVKISIWEDEAHSYCIDDEVRVLATADLVVDDGSVSTAMSYYENIDPYDEDDIDNYIFDKYGQCDFDWYIDEESFEVE